MSDDWDFYFCRVDDRPASVFLDLGISKDAPIRHFSVLAYVRLYLQEPRPDGLSSQSEFEALKNVEDALERLQADGSAKYVGRNTSDGCRDYYFYAHIGDRWDERVARIMRAFPSYKFEYGTRDDPEWSTYFGFLYPSEEDRERIQNRRTCEALEKNGDPLEKERPINHWAYFSSPASREAFVTAAKDLGYEVVGLLEPELGDSRYGVTLSCAGVPSFKMIDGLTLPLLRAARDHDGEYDGWETEVVR